MWREGSKNVGWGGSLATAFTVAVALPFLFFHFLVKFIDLFPDLVPVFGVRVEIQIAPVRLDGLFLQALFLLGFGQVSKRDGITGFGLGCVLKTIDGGIPIALLHVVLADFEILFDTQRGPGGLVGRVLRGGVFLVFGGGVWGRCIRRVGWFGGGLRLRCLCVHGHYSKQRENCGENRNCLAESHAAYRGLPVLRLGLV